jgi:two-component system, LytTR family, sensor kinase
MASTPPTVPTHRALETRGGRIPYRSLFRTALLTTPLLTVGFVGPIFIAAEFALEFIWIIFPGVIGICMVAWTLNIGFLRFRERLGRWKWLQVFILGGFMIGISFVMYALFGQYLPPLASRLSGIRFVNAFAINAIIYVIIDLRLLSETKTRLVEENAQLRLSSLETQYQILKDQVNPHFLFNALGTARSLVRRDPAATEAYIIRLSDFLRATLQDVKDHVTLAEELRLVRDYIELQRMRFREALDFQCTVAEDSCRLPYFSLLTLVENAVKHNAMTPESPLRIRITRTGDHITVWNNRQSKALHLPSNGSGLTNLQKRCQVLGHGDIEVVEERETFAVTLKLLCASS